MKRTWCISSQTNKPSSTSESTRWHLLQAFSKASTTFSTVTRGCLLLSPLVTPIPSPLFMHYPRCIIYTCTYNILKIFKHMRIIFSHSILALLGFILRTVLGPLDLYQLHESIPDIFDLPIQYANWSYLKYAFYIHLNYIPINDMINVRYIFLKK
jgi:hypothetical protein